MSRPVGSNATLDIQESGSALAADASEMFVRMAREVTDGGSPFRVALSGGSTPKLLYGLLASDTFRDEVPWGRIEFFFGDERWVPSTSKDSNYKLANDTLFKPASVSQDSVFPIPTEAATPEEAASRYEETIRRVFRLTQGEMPRFDLIFLGMGEDGHTASLFPHSPALHESGKLVAANFVEKLDTNRITLTAPVLNNAAEVLFMVAGEDKATALREVLEGADNPEEYPSQLLRGALGHVTWLVDRAAASQLSSGK